MLSKQQLLSKFNENKEHYQKKEIGDGTQSFCRDVFESEIFSLKSGDTKVSGNFRYEATVEGEGDRGDDFILNIDGIIVPVEVEKLNNIQKGESQIENYMKRKKSLYGILTDGYIWKFYTQGYSLEKATLTLTLDELITQEGQIKKDRVFIKKDYYLNSFSSLSALVAQNNDFIIEDFHNDLIRLAEDVKRDFFTAGAFSFGASDENQIKGVYSFIIQFILLKIIQDKKRGLDLLGVDEVKVFLQEEKWNKLTQHIFKKLQFLGEFYSSYRNEQEELLRKIREKYTEAHVADYDLEALKPFLDLYVFIIKYNFKKTNSDLFGAVYENYLKEIYREDNTKKGQVFTPPEIVEYMLDEVGYSTEYIREKIEEYGIQKIRETLINWAPIGKSDYSPEEIEKQYFNIPGLSIIDPACGSGTFLYKAAGRIANAIEKLPFNSREKGLLAESLIINNIVGFDIEAFPLYLAEMNILITLLWHNIDDTNGKILNRIDKQIRVFSTNDSIAEFANSEESITESVINSLSHAPGFMASILSKRDEKEILKIYMDIREVDKDHLRESIKVKYLKTALTPQSPTLIKAILKAKSVEDIKKVFTSSATTTDINETLEKTKYLAEYQKLEKNILPKLNVLITNLLSRHEAHRTKFDFVVGNPPYVKGNIKYDSKSLFGININDKRYSKIDIGNGRYITMANSQLNIYAYFFYLGYYLLQNSGKLCYIVPRSFLFQSSFHKLREFLKLNTNINRIHDFGLGSLFYNRGLGQNILISTDSCIIQTIKTLPSNKKVFISQYTGGRGNIRLEDYIENKNEYHIQYFDLFSQKNKGYLMSAYLDYLKSYSEKDFHISIYPRVEIGKKNNKRNVEGKGHIIFQQLGYVSNQNNLVQEFYDYDSIGALQDRPTCKIIANKKYRLTWSSVSGRQKRHIFTFTDYKHIHNWNAFTSIGIDKDENLPELMYLFGILNSRPIQKQIQDDFGGVCNMTNLQLLAVPKIDSPAKDLLKKNLISNSLQIIKLAKQLQGILILGDIIEIERNCLDIGKIQIKNEYAYVTLLDIGCGIEEINLSAPLSKETIKQVQNENPQMKKLELERDSIVEELYELD